MVLEAQNNPFTSVLFVGAADPEALPDADPSAGSYRLVVDDTGVPWIVDSTGTAAAIGGATSASGVSVADAGSLFTATDAEAAFQEIAKKSIGYTAHGNTGATETFDALTAWHSATLDASCTFTFTGATSGLVASMILELVQGGAGSHTVTWPGSVVWPGGVAPTLSTAPAATDVVTLFSRDGGTTWFGFMQGGGGSSGSVATDTIWDAAGDLVQGTGANTAAKLTLGAAGTVVRSTGSANAYAFPPGYEFDYVAKTSSTSITGTNEAGANTIVTGTSVAYDGSTVVMVEFFCPNVTVAGTNLAYVVVLLYEDSTLLGQWGIVRNMTGASTASFTPVKLGLRRTPSNASHQYVVKAYTSTGTSTVEGGTGGTGAYVAAYVRVTKV